MALFFECVLQCAQNVLDAADIVRDGDFSPTIVLVLAILKGMPTIYYSTQQLCVRHRT